VVIFNVEYRLAPETTCPNNIKVNIAAFNDKKENQIFLVYKEIQNGAVEKSYLTNDLLIFG
jgi:hypothetical protein